MTGQFLYRRRAFIALLGGAAAWPLAARAQQPAMPVIGFLTNGTPDRSTNIVAAFHKGLEETGHVEGSNVAVEYRWAGDRNDHLPELVSDLVRRQVTVVAAFNNASVFAAKAATTTIPIVFIGSVDPVASGLVFSLNRPGGNVTGVTTLNVEVGPKRLELLHELFPTTRRFALLVNPENPASATDTAHAQQAARAIGLQLSIVNASRTHDLATAFAEAKARKPAPS